MLSSSVTTVLARQFVTTEINEFNTSLSVMTPNNKSELIVQAAILAFLTAVLPIETRQIDIAFNILNIPINELFE
jgi:hypothetical protein